MHSFGGIPINTSPFLTIRHEDWSEVRSPSRALRRMKQGHKQRVRYLEIPNPKVFVMGGMICGHPETIKKMLASVKTESSADV